MSLSTLLDDYNKDVTTWLEQAKKEVAALQKLQKAVANGNLRDVEKLRQGARANAELVNQRAVELAPLEFDAEAYLAEGGAFLPELQDAAVKAGVRLSERDGIIFCYPVLVRTEPELSAVRIDKKLEANVRPETLAALLKKAQSKDPKTRPERFIETLFEAYELALAKRKIDAYIDIPLTQIYEILTLLPGTEKDYTMLDFIREIYFLDSSDVHTTKKGYHISYPKSTQSRERSTKSFKFVTRSGEERDYVAIKFDRGGDE